MPRVGEGRRWAFRICAVFLAPLLLLAAAEGVLRLGGYGYRTGFFQTIRLGQTDYRINNEDFSLRFFPPQLARWPEPIMFPAHKPPHAFRIFVLGESAARGEPEPPFSAARYLEALLGERFPGRQFEVINLAITAINSHVILPIARVCADCQGDLWLIYMGNNEMVGPFGAATVFGAKAPPLALVQLNLLVQRTRLGQALMALSRRLRGKPAQTSWHGMQMFLGNQVPPKDPRKETVYHNFQRNLQDILRVGLNSGARVLLSTVAVNLRDCPPFASLPANKLSGQDQSRFQQLFADACRAQSGSNWAAAAAGFERAAQVAPDFAELQFRWAEALLALTNLPAAREHFQAACDDDALPFRADSRVNRIISEVGGSMAGTNLVLVDAAAALQVPTDGSPDPSHPWMLPPGQESFYEHVHFNFDGQYRLARVWAEQVERLLPSAMRSRAQASWAEQQTCERRLGLTDWNRAAVLESVMWRLHRPPLSGQLNNTNRLRALEAERGQLRLRMNPVTAQAARAAYLEALARAPGDHFLHEVYAEFLESGGELREAAAQWRQVTELLPRGALGFYQWGRLQEQQNQPAPAEPPLQRALALRPRFPEGWYELGNVHFLQTNYVLALDDYRRAAQLDPQVAAYVALAGRSLSKLNRHQEAIAQYRQALAIQPDACETHFALGDELAAGNQFDQAQAEYEAVIRFQPTNVLAHLDNGVMLAREGQFEPAIREFEETLRLEPQNRPAQEYLARVQQWQAERRSRGR
ncbi:MAG TPA: tetratricopeptide repeat protein [Verrucomicrobiae bacterium]|nr:tetratricopeptide repeat protein [Verrucomicrobiae bacterium]